MQHSRFFQAIALAAGTAFAVLPALLSAASVDPGIGAKANARSVWLVYFDEPPLASFHGAADAAVQPKLRGLEATSPAVTGAARLDVESSASLAYRAALTSLREERLGEAGRSMGRKLEPLFVYDVVNNGVALELTGAEAALIAKQKGVARIEPDFVRKLMTDAGPRWIHADSMWGAPGGGYRGEGRIVGVVDTGINARHRAFDAVSGRFTIQNPRSGYLGLCANSPTAGCNDKLIGIYDFTTGDKDAEVNDGSDRQGHGTHVASTAAGDPITVSLSSGTYSLSGVAPRANIVSYKACEVDASCQGSWVLAALNRAVADRVDVINYSIGGGNPSPWSAGDAVAMLNAYEAGIVVAVAAGNEGPDPGSLTSPGSAPWVIGVANTTHDRGNVARLTLSGGNAPLPGAGVLAGASLTAAPYGPMPIVYAGNYGSALCATGPNVNALPPDTSTSPWSFNPFNGQIVVCDRGTYARVIKGLNVKNAGGGGMVLVNAASDGVSVVADSHQLPATHLTYADGVALKQWLQQGSGHQATIGASTLEYLPMFADLLASSSGRGPVDGDWLKPNVAAPGTNILAAFKDGSGSTSSFAYMSGTSMASPHVAGAALLLRQMHSDWGPGEVASALQGTARASVLMPDGASPAGFMDGGAGVVDLAKAANPGLVFPVTAAQFRSADPAIGGKPRELNLGALVDRQCMLSCAFTRTVRNLGAQGQWQATVEMNGGTLQVSPTSFTLAAGATQALQFQFAVGASADYGKWQEGRVVLKKVGGGVSDTVIPVSIRPSAGTLPLMIELPAAGGMVDGESGWAETTLSGIVPLDSARFSGSDLVEPLTANPRIPQDPTKDKVYDNLLSTDEGVSIFRLQAERSGRVRLRVDARSETSRDIDLYVGRAGSATEMPNEDSEICISGSSGAVEKCDMVLDVTAGERFWILVQNWQSSTAGADNVAVQAALVPIAASTAEPALRPLVATGPGHTALRESFPVRLSWNAPDMAPGDSRWGHLLIGASAASPTGIGSVLVKIKRSPNPAGAAAMLQPGITRTMQLLPEQAQERLYIDVPPNATRLRVTSHGEGEVKLYLAHDPAPVTPTIAAAPARTAAAASSSQAGANDEVSVSGATLKSGRWYVTPVNTGSTRAKFDLDVALDFAGNRAQPGWGNWYDPKTDGSGFFLSPYADGAIWVLTWYTYAEDGAPVWYLGTAQAPAATQGSVSFDMARYSWNGQQPHDVAVGRVTLSLVDGRRMRVSWNMDGQSGSQSLERIEAGGCRNLGTTGKKPDGNWYTPARSGFGFEALTFPGMEVYIGYVYDGRGFARWAMADRGQDAAIGGDVQITANLRRGACPLCTYAAPLVEPAGTLTRRYSSATRGHFGLNVNLPGTGGGNWTSSEDVEMLTSPIACP